MICSLINVKFKSYKHLYLKKDVSKCIQTVQETNNIAITHPTLHNEKSA